MATTNITQKAPRRLRNSAENQVLVAWFVTLFLSLMLLGGVPHWALAVLALSAALAALLGLRQRRVRSHVAKIALGLCWLSLAQLVILPDSWVELLSPMAANIWSRGLGPEATERLAHSISIDRSATAAEAIKWAIYAAVLFLSAQVSRVNGIRRTLSLIYWLFVGLAITTLVHGLMQAEMVFGLYRPGFNPATWALSPVLNPNNLSSLLNLGFFVGLGLSFSSKPSAEHWAIRGTLPLLMGVSILSGSRAGLLLLFGGLIATLPTFFSPRRHKNSGEGDGATLGRLLVWFSVLAGGAALAFLAAPEGLWLKVTDNDLSKFRILDWSRALISDFYLTGVGAGAFETGFMKYRQVGGNYVWEHPENFIVNWLAQWGLIGGTLALVSIIWALRPSQLAFRQRPLVPCALLGLAVVTIHNFADVGFRTPGVMVMTCSVIGTLWWKTPSSNTSESATAHSKPLLLPLTISTIAIASVCLWSLGWSSIAAERREVEELLSRTDFKNETAAAVFKHRLRSAMGRHPADVYLTLAGAIAAEASENPQALAWTAEALKRDPRNSRVHFLLADQLQRRGALHQALLELRTAIELDATMGRVAILRALQWNTDEETLLRIVPKGRPGAPILVNLSHLTRGVSLETKVHWLEDAVDRDPEATLVRTQLLHALLSAMEGKSSPCENVSTCVATTKRHLEHPSLRRLTNQDSLSNQLLLLSRLLFIEGKQLESIKILKSSCPRHIAKCLYHWLNLASRNGGNATEPAELLLELECLEISRCAAAHRNIAKAHLRLNNLEQALSHFQNAARRKPTKEGWEQVASVAKRLGRETVELKAREEISNLPVEE